MTCTRVAVTISYGLGLCSYIGRRGSIISSSSFSNILDVKSMSGIYSDRSLRGSVFSVYKGLLRYILCVRRTRTFLCMYIVYIIIYKMCSDRISFQNPSQICYTRASYMRGHTTFLKTYK